MLAHFQLLPSSPSSNSADDDSKLWPSIVLAATHLKAKSGNEALRENQAAELLDGTRAFMNAQGVAATAAVVVVGDFNETPENPAIVTMRSAGPDSARVAFPHRLLDAYQPLFATREQPYTTYKRRKRVCDHDPD